MLLNKKQLNQFYSLSFLLVMASLLAYVIYKAFNCAITNDEAYSFRLVHTGSLTVLVGTANTHWLNSLVMYLFGNLAGFTDPGPLRVSSISGFVIYGYAVYRFARSFDQKAVSFAAVTVLLLNPLMLDYFSIARGYGLAVGLMTLGLFYLLKAFKTNDQAVLLKAWIILAIAVAANYCAFYIFFSAALFYFLIVYRNKEARVLIKDKKLLRLSIFIIVFVTLCAVANLLLIRYAGDLQYGGDRSFFETITSLITFSAYGDVKDNIALILAKLFTFVILSMSAYQLFKNFSLRKYSPAYVLGFIIIATFLIFQTLHIIGGTPFLLGRTALVLIPVYALFFLFVADSFTTDRIRKTLSLICYTAGVLAILNFIRTANTDFFYEWRSGADASAQLQHINSVTANNKPEKRPVVFLHSIHGIFINYYSFINPEGYYFDPLPRVDWDPLNANVIFNKADIAILPDDFWRIHEPAQKNNYRLIRTYRVSETVMVERIIQ